MIWRKNNSGFSLVEILVVLVIMGLVVTAVYATFLSTQKQAYTQEAVIEVQQNLRAALDFLVKDIRMARFMSPPEENALVNAPAQMLVDANDNGIYENTLDERPLFSLVSASSLYGYARVIGEMAGGVLVAPGTSQQFAAGDAVRVFRPVSLNPATGVYAVSGISPGTTDGVELSGYVAGAAAVGDLLVRMPAGAGNDDFPLQIDYQLVADPSSSDINMNQLQRRITDRDGNIIENFQLIASNISNIALNYLDKSGNPVSDLSEVVAVEITMTAQTDATKTGRSNFSGVKGRSLSTTVKIYNGVSL